MAITYPLVHPATPGFRSIRIAPQNAVAVTESPYSLATQVQAHQGQRWIADVSLPPIKQDTTADEWAAFLTALRGRYGTFLLGDSARKLPRGLGSGTGLLPYVYGSSQTGNELIIGGFPADQQYAFRAGDYIQIGRTNLLKYSQDLTAADWYKNNITITANSVAAPDGTTTADTIMAGSGDCYALQYFTNQRQGSYHTFSIWLRSVSGTQNISIAVHNGADYSGGSVVCGLTTSWQRFSVSNKWSGVGTNFVMIGRATGIPAGAVFYAWGAQINPGSSPDAYTATTSAAIIEKPRLHKIMRDVSSDSNGRIAAQIYPMLRGSPTDGAYIKTSNCVGVFRMAEEPSWDVDAAKLYGISFRAVEDI